MTKVPVNRQSHDTKQEILQLVDIVSSNFKKMAVKDDQFKEMIGKLFVVHTFAGVRHTEFVELFLIELVHCQFSYYYSLALEKDFRVTFRGRGEYEDKVISDKVLTEEDALPQIKKVLLKLLTPVGAKRYLLQEWGEAPFNFPL